MVGRATLSSVVSRPITKRLNAIAARAHQGHRRRPKCFERPLARLPRRVFDQPALPTKQEHQSKMTLSRAQGAGPLIDPSRSLIPAAPAAAAMVIAAPAAQEVSDGSRHHRRSPRSNSASRHYESLRQLRRPRGEAVPGTQRFPGAIDAQARPMPGRDPPLRSRNASDPGRPVGRIPGEARQGARRDPGPAPGRAGPLVLERW